MTLFCLLKISDTDLLSQDCLQKMKKLLKLLTHIQLKFNNQIQKNASYGYYAENYSANFRQILKSLVAFSSLDIW